MYVCVCVFRAFIEQISIKTLFLRNKGRPHLNVVLCLFVCRSYCCFSSFFCWRCCSFMLSHVPHLVGLSEALRIPCSADIIYVLCVCVNANNFLFYILGCTEFPQQAILLLLLALLLACKCLCVCVCLCLNCMLLFCNNTLLMFKWLLTALLLPLLLFLCCCCCGCYSYCRNTRSDKPSTTQKRTRNWAHMCKRTFLHAYSYV